MAKISIEIAYTPPTKQTVLQIKVAPGSTILTALRKAKFFSLFPELNIDFIKVGIFGELKTLDTQLNEGDRIEIYRPLIIDPRQARFNRLKAKKRAN